MKNKLQTLRKEIYIMAHNYDVELDEKKIESIEDEKELIRIVGLIKRVIQYRN